MKKVLVITYYWPPAGGAGVQRWVKFAAYLRGCGWEPVIYTPSNPEPGTVDKALEESLPSGLEVIQRPIREPYEIYRRLTGGASTQVTELAGGSSGSRVGSHAQNAGEGRSVCGSDAARAGKPSLSKRLSLFIRGNFFVPDPRCGWVRPSVRFISGWLREHPVDAVVTTGPPHSMHLIGRGLHRRLGIPWVADFRDPWTKMFYFKDLRMLPCIRRRHLRLEQSVLDEASAVVAVSPQVRDDFAARTKTRVELITNGYDAADFEGPEPEAEHVHFTLTHTGNIGADGDPAVLWQVLANLCSTDQGFRAGFRLRLCGKVDAGVVRSILAAGVPEENLVLEGYLPHPETVAAQRSADLLLLPLRYGSEGGKVVPGKTFEYLAARRPVLGIGDPSGSAAGILRETGCGRMYDWDDADGMRDAVMAAWERFVSVSRRLAMAGNAASAPSYSGPDGFTPVISSIESYSREALTARYAALLDSLVR